MFVKRNITIENARLIFKNFKGEETQFNPKGHRNFSVVLDTEIAQSLQEDGWNVRFLKPKDEGDDPMPILQVSVRFDNIPPKIVLITHKGKTVIGEDEIGMLDWAEVEKFDLIIRPYNWEVSGKSGIKAYLKTLYVTLAEDDLESKYEDIPDR